MVTAEPYVWCEQPSKLEGRNANPWQRTNSEFARAAFVLVCATFRIVVYSVLTQCVESDALHPVTPYNDSVLLARLDSAGRDKLSGDLNGRYKDLLSENGQHMRDLKAGQLLANQLASPLLEFHFYNRGFCRLAAVSALQILAIESRQFLPRDLAIGLFIDLFGAFDAGTRGLLPFIPSTGCRNIVTQNAN
jgi:hypothetical protein